MLICQLFCTIIASDIRVYNPIFTVKMDRYDGSGIHDHLFNYISMPFILLIPVGIPHLIIQQFERIDIHIYRNKSTTLNSVNQLQCSS